MDFELSDEQRMLAESLGRWLERNYDLAAREAAQADPPGFPAALWEGLAELGAMAALLPEEAGGLGGGGFDIATVFEALGHALVAAPLCEGVLMPARALIAAGRADEAAPLAEGRGRLAFVHDEPGAQYERNRIATR
ncbi:MAG: pimeloyl-CoA dehydrogenase small subunit, partial [Alphaproteobacteria bacterium]